MNAGFLKDRQPRTFTGIGSAKEWKEIDYAVERIRIKLSSRAVTEVADLTSEITHESISHRLNKRELRIKLRDRLLQEYETPKQRREMDSPAFSAAISPS